MAIAFASGSPFRQRNGKGDDLRSLVFILPGFEVALETGD
jgi:hypothetical protein